MPHLQPLPLLSVLDLRPSSREESVPMTHQGTSGEWWCKCGHPRESHDTIDEDGMRRCLDTHAGNSLPCHCQDFTRTRSRFETASAIARAGSR